MDETAWPSEFVGSSTLGLLMLCMLYDRSRIRCIHGRILDPVPRSPFPVSWLVEDEEETVGMETSRVSENNLEPEKVFEFIISYVSE